MSRGISHFLCENNIYKNDFTVTLFYKKIINKNYIIYYAEHINRPVRKPEQL